MFRQFLPVSLSYSSFHFISFPFLSLHPFSPLTYLSFSFLSLFPSRSLPCAVLLKLPHPPTHPTQIILCLAITSDSQICHLNFENQKLK